MKKAMYIKSIMLGMLLLISLSAIGQVQVIRSAKGNITITPIFHGSLVLQWNGKTVYVDPYGGTERYQSLPAPDLVLITHAHGDHMNPETLKGLDIEKAELFAPKLVMDGLAEIEFARKTIVTNGEKVEWNDIKIEAIPMYNLKEAGRHKKGDGNGYVLTMGGNRIYISGDTEDIPEMRHLENIDVAFVCMNLPYTMDVQQAADAVLDFKPRIIYPYHYRGAENKFSDIEKFKSLVKAGDKKIDVRLLDWYK